jgi:hypothetical protein
MAQPYQLIAPLPSLEPSVVLRISDGAFIPFDPGNRDYQIFKQWCDEGNTPDPAPTPPMTKGNPP